MARELLGRKLSLRVLGLLLALSLSAFAREGLSHEVNIAKAAHFYFTSTENQRQQDFLLSLPKDLSTFHEVTLKFRLRCPSDSCDYWDRLGSLGLVNESGHYLELMRFVTPYGIGAEWQTDLSHFLPLLTGEKTLRLFIDTWVGPGHAQGEGWLVDASLVFAKGSPRREGRVVAVIPFLSFQDIVYGDPLRPERQTRDFDGLPAFQSAAILNIITGHGQGNKDHCAEFCAKEHHVTVGGLRFKRKVWRDDCAHTVSKQQMGNYLSPRAGWCPGDQVRPWVIELNPLSFTSQSSFVYDVEPYVNSCRPDASPCSGCVFGTSCLYDESLHTEPRFVVSSYLILRN